MRFACYQPDEAASGAGILSHILSTPVLIFLSMGDALAIIAKRLITLDRMSLAVAGPVDGAEGQLHE